MLARAVFSEGDAARPITASQPPGAHDRLASITGQGWRGRISLERVLVDRDGPAIVAEVGRPSRWQISRRGAICGRPGTISAMVRIADLGEQRGRSSEALPILGYFSKEQLFRL